MIDSPCRELSRAELLEERNAALARESCLKEELALERYHHAACLSIAEGAPGWETFPDVFPSTEAVKLLRQRFENLRSVQFKRN